ncbi:MAG: monovalent cation/H+ antiporter subunit A [Gammaproteobacteria bacterium]|nr:monovalent cation/H+ antiporter subunit A [Gammaproteobacteria bacterium]MBU0786380.1 monovalent cation/H+ antiporter subunit A [Gammaproteobacteria bacterium]MBU0814398.1 monovalent cation/H+ antiporter subunit A [Gammaproteobacteria bacterium]MBU1786757.1 monovalent cation/H+ antiporter subunit A [Gammaproteobacteria bacterium]
MLLLIILLPLLAGTVLTGWSGAWPSASYRARTAWLAAAVTASSFALLLQRAPAVMRGDVQRAFLPWVPEIGLNLGLRLDGLSLMFALLITGIGLLIILYAHFYLGKDDPVGKFFSTLMLFMAAMLGIALSDNLLLLIVFWELTSISSFLLVGYWNHREDARSGARMALAVTGGGGLALLGGFVLLGQIAGTYELSQMLGQGARIQADVRYPAALLLILLGCFTKSAQFPFHFWLPQAMAAPTPVSAYLHSATMVKAGIFLLAVLTPVIGGTALFAGLVAGTGLVTMVFAAFIAIFKHDLKALLAYSTISHLGLIVFLIGLGSPLAAVAAMFHILNHASFKGALFMIAGIVDHETGTRDMRLLSGLRHLMPWTATLAMVTAAAMAGVPLFNGFLSKEMFLTETVTFAQAGGWRWLVPTLATLGALFSVAYSVRLVHGIFFGAPATGMPHAHPHEPPLGMKAPVILLAVICVAVGLLPALLLGPIVLVAATAMLGTAPPEYHLALWHGLNLPLLLGVLALAGGTALYFMLTRGGRLQHLNSENWFGLLTGLRLFTQGTDKLLRFAGLLTSRVENTSLQRYIAWMLMATLVVAAVPLWGGHPGTGTRTLLPVSLPALVVWALLLLSCAWLVLHHHARFLSVLVIGVVGLAVALAFVGFSAPDLALTQLTVEVVSTVLLLMGLALLPQQTPQESSRGRHIRDAALAVLGGVGIAWLAWVMLTRDHDSIAWYFLNQSAVAGGGTNVVNVILVDFRGYDTFGEITVLGIAAIGVLALMDGMRTRRPGMDAEGRPWTFASQPLMLKVAARVVLPLALVVTLYIFMRGHNLPGGGFIAGLITAVALVLQYMAMGQSRAEAVLRADGASRFVRWIGFGLGIAGLTGVGAFIFGQPFLSSAHGHPHLPLLGDVPLASAALFDLGVYITVVGSTLLTLSTLGTVTRESGGATAPDQRKGGRP